MILGIGDMVEILSLPYRNTRNKKAEDFVCPVCGKKKMHIDFGNNVFHCPACDSIGGGALDFWAFFRNIDAVSKKEKYRLVKIDIENFAGGRSASFQLKGNQLLSFSTDEVASVENRDKAFRALFSKLTLEDKHRKALRKRGFTDNEIKSFGFKSYPSKTQGNKAIASLLQENVDLTNIPGFYKEDNKWKLRKYSSGIIIPEKNGKNQVQSFQVRLDNPLNGTRYLNISSSNLEGGTKGESCLHLAWNFKKDSLKNIILTEGPLKADVIYRYSKVPTLAMPGVNASKKLESTLLQMRTKGLKNIYLCFDMDYRTNIHVEKALRKVERIIENCELSYTQMVWDEKFKGFDDYLHDIKELRL